MNDLTILLWVMGGCFGIIFGLLILMWNSIDKRIDKLDEKVTDIDRRLCHLQGAFSQKECCMIKDTGNIKVAE